MNRQNLLFTIIGLLAGFIGGFVLANNLNRSSALQNSVAQNPAGAPNNLQIQSADIKENPNGAMMPQVAETLEKADRDPKNFAAQIQAGQMFARIQNTAKANEFLQRAVEARQDKFEDLATLGNGFFDLKNFEEAEKWYSKALEKNPEDVDVRTDLGSTFMERANPDLDRAIKEYQTSLSKNPNHENSLFNLAIAYSRKGNADGAQENLAKLEKLNPTSSLVTRLKQRLAADQK